MKRRPWFRWALVGFASASPAGAADSDLDALLSEKIVVTASRTAETESTAPATVSSISADDLRRHGIRSLADAVNFLSLGMFAQESPLDGPELGARGVALSGAENSHILLQLNGHTLNDGLNAVAGATQYGGMPLELVDHIEVVLGPGSVLYGANAMLGVINVVTKHANAVHGTHVVGEAYLVPPATRGQDPDRHESYWSDSGRAGRGAVFGGYQFQLLGAPADLTFDLQYAHRSAPAFSYGYPFGTKTASGTDTLSNDLPSLFGRLSVGDLEINVRGARLGQRSTTPASEWMYIVRDGADGPPRTESVDQWLDIDAQYTKSLSARVGLNARVFGDVGETNRTTTTYDAILRCDASMPLGCRHESPSSARLVGAELQSSLRWTDDGSLSTLLGVVGRIRSISGAVNYFDVVTSEATTYSHFSVHESNAAAYVQQSWAPASFLDLNLGARWDYEERFGDKISPRAAAVLKPWHGGALKAVYSEAFRGPSIRESFVSEPSGRLLADPLKPESVRSVQASVEQRFGAHRLMTGLFRSWWTDLVGSRSYLDVGAGGGGDPRIVAAKSEGALFPYVGSAAQYQNLSAIDNYGIEMSYAGTALERRLAFGANATIARAYRNGASSDSFLSTAPVLSGNARVSYDVDPQLLTLGLAGYLLGERYAQSAYASIYPTPPKAPAQVELRLTASGGVPGVPRLSYRLVGGYATSAGTAYVSTLPPIYQNGPQAPQALRPAERYMTLMGLEYEF